MSFHENSDARLSNSKQTPLTQYGVIILDLLLKADLSKPALYKPEGPRAVSQQAKAEKNTAVCYEISSKICPGVQKGNHNMLDEERGRPHL